MPSRYQDFNMDYDHLAMSVESFVNDVPQSFEEAKSRDDFHLWEQAISEEIKALKSNNTWTLVNRPENTPLIDSKWVFRLKKDNEGKVQKYKARLVARGFMQRRGFDYEETWAPVARLSTVRTLIAVINYKNLAVQQMDVKSAFLHGTINENIYMKKPEGLNCGNKVCKLNKALYGLKQAPYCWNKKFNQFATEQELIRSDNDPCLYYKHIGNIEIYLLLYVDDIIIASNSKIELNKLKEKLTKNFEMQDMGELKQFLGIHIRKTEDGMYLSQKDYIQSLLEKFRMQDCNGSKIPMNMNKMFYEKKENTDTTNKPIRELIGSLMYLTLATRPDLSASVNFCSRNQNNPTEELWILLKGILRYLKQTVNFELFFDNKVSTELEGYADSDWAGDESDRKSTTGFLFKVLGSTVCWTTKKQSSVAISSTEAEYVALAEAAREGIWLLNLLESFGFAKTTFTIYEDNQSCIELTRKWEHKRLKHVDVKYNFIRDLVENKTISVKYINSNNQTADILTKNLKYPLFSKHRFHLGLRE